jgi:hypothetical protein
MATDYGLDDRMIGVRIPAGGGNLSLRYRVQTGSGAHTASYSMGTGGDRDVKLTTHFHLMPRSRMRGTIPTFPQ